MHANPGTGNARGSKSDGMIPVQMEFNDAMGMYSEMIHKCIPRTLVNTDTTSRWPRSPSNSPRLRREFGAFQPDNGRCPSVKTSFQEAQDRRSAVLPAVAAESAGFPSPAAR